MCVSSALKKLYNCKEVLSILKIVLQIYDYKYSDIRKYGTFVSHCWNLHSNEFHWKHYLRPTTRLWKKIQSLIYLNTFNLNDLRELYINRNNCIPDNKFNNIKTFPLSFNEITTSAPSGETLACWQSENHICLSLLFFGSWSPYSY